MELTLDQGGDRKEFAIVKKILEYANRRPIGVTNDNPILDSRMYEVKYRDGYLAAKEASVIDENLFTQVDQEGNRFVLINSTIKTRTDGTQTLQQDAFVITKCGTKLIKNTTKGWEVCIQWKYVINTWNKIKDIKDSYPIKMAEYAVDNRISEDPTFT